MLTRHPLFITGAFLLLDLLRDAMRIEDMGVRKAAVWQELDHGQFERQLQGVEHLSMRRLHKLPLRVIRRFFWLGVIQFGPPPDARRALVVQLALMGQKRMAKLEKAVQRAEKSA